MSAGGNYAYCITPSKKTPAAGTYTKHYDVATYMKTPGRRVSSGKFKTYSLLLLGSTGL